VTHNQAGKAVSVRGSIDADDLGFTLMHEHLFIDLRQYHQPHSSDVTTQSNSPPIFDSADFPSTELEIWESPVDLGNLHLPQRLGPVSDQWVLADESAAVKETVEFKNLGGTTIVDVTNIGLKRDPEGLKRVSEATDVNIIMGTSWYQKVFHPIDMDKRTVEGMTQELVRDVTIGVGETGIRSGIIGEVGVNGDPITPNEEKSIRASARASVITGSSITFHLNPRGGLGVEKHDILNMVEEEGADLTRVALGHCNSIANDFPFMQELLDRGVYVEFELVGQSESLNSSVVKVCAEAVPTLIEAGYGSKILLSQDVCAKTHLKRYGGPGYTYMQASFIPHLKTLGVTNLDIEHIFIENPSQLLAFAASG
jgi:phosphotriesterase-related protein